MKKESPAQDERLLLTPCLFSELPKNTEAIFSKKVHCVFFTWPESCSYYWQGGVYDRCTVPPVGDTQRKELTAKLGQNFRNETFYCGSEQNKSMTFNVLFLSSVFDPLQIKPVGVKRRMNRYKDIIKAKKWYYTIPAHKTFSNIKWQQAALFLDYTVTSIWTAMTWILGVTSARHLVLRCVHFLHGHYTLISRSHVLKPVDAQWTLALITETQRSPSELHPLRWIIDVKSVFV